MGGKNYRDLDMWKDIPEYEGLYKINENGIVINAKNNKIRKTQILKGYLIIGLSKNDKRKIYKIHQLVAMAFLNHKPCGMKLVIDHIDNDKLNNNYLNLRITNQRENSNNRKNKSGLVGVNFHKKAGKYTSSIRLNGQKVYLGLFDNEYEAHLAYESKLTEYASLS
jgi:hypothetical protein